MKGWKCLALSIGMFFGLQGCTSPPPVKINPVELPQHGLDFRVISDKTIYQLGEPVVIKVRVKNFWAKPRTLRILPDEKRRFSFEYCLDTPYTYGDICHSSDKAIALTIPPNKEVEIGEMTWVWDQVDPCLKEPVGIGRYFFRSPRLAHVEVDGQSIGLVEIVVEEGEIDGAFRRLSFDIIHPTLEILRVRNIEFLVYASGTKELMNIQVSVINLSNLMRGQQTVTIKPVGINPTLKVRILGPVSEGCPLRLRAVYEFKEVLSIPIPSKGDLVEVIKFSWDLHDQMTGELVPDGLYMTLVELCGLVEVNGEKVGVIQNPIKICAGLFRKEG